MGLNLGEKLRYGFRGIPETDYMSIDITNRCNLRCKHCYYYAQDFPGELSLEEWVNRLEELRHDPRFTFRRCVWVGGEPLLRKDVLEKLMPYFRTNTVVTNGLLELPEWKGVTFYISVDGTEPYYEEIRGIKGAYGKIKNNADRKDLYVYLTFCVNRSNHFCIEDMLEEWSETGVRGMVFEFHTPVGGLDEALTLDDELRDALVDRILRLKRKYYTFILNPDRSLYMLRSENCREVTDRCLFREKGVSLDAAGRLKRPCMMGPRAECNRCGCAVPFYLRAMEEKRFLPHEFSLMGGRFLVNRAGSIASRFGLRRKETGQPTTK
jgi:MoaA/NifB/PqqE/SkfB family radical SAM enzyme